MMLSVSSIQGLYDSLLDASFRGVAFSIIDARHEVGRRAHRFLFPGTELTVFQDYGPLDGPIKVTGLISGDDYAHQAWRLHTAFRTAGPATLVHPWLGELQVMCEKPASISFNHGELRIVRFEAEFLSYDPLIAPQASLLEAVMDKIDAVVASAKSWLHKVLAPVAMALAAFAYAQRFASAAVGWFHAVIGGGASASAMQAAAAPALAQLAVVPAALPSATFAATATDSLLAVPAAIAASSVPTPPAAVGPGESAVAPEVADPRDAAAALLAVAAQIAAAAIDVRLSLAMAAAVQAATVAEAMRAASDIEYTSQQDATAWRTRLLAALDAAAAAAARLASADPLGAGAMWRSLMALRAAFLADMSTTIGRLPAVTLLRPPGPAPVWLLAYYLAGDDPALVVPAYLDLVARNAIAHPGLALSTPIEVLGRGGDVVVEAAPVSRVLTDDSDALITDDLNSPMEIS